MSGAHAPASRARRAPAAPAVPPQGTGRPAAARPPHPRSSVRYDAARTHRRPPAPDPAGPRPRRHFLDYDHAYGLDADGPRIAEAHRERYGPAEPPGPDTGSEIPSLIQYTVNAASPAWQRLDTLIRGHLST
ncbi:hypothetical protein ACTVZO_36345 [Streptomyces sp. IBSNAI002]|uniref:hypothetical protein n=1 Tax=Streptomyces sp. IBSNAI002 TaxID=3457500 RepID=UPI003FD261BF